MSGRICYYNICKYVFLRMLMIICKLRDLVILNATYDHIRDLVMLKTPTGKRQWAQIVHMAIRYFAHDHMLFCSWPYAILLMAIRYFAHGHTLFRSWPYAILLMSIRYLAHGHTLFRSWPYAILLMTICYFVIRGSDHM